VGHARATRYALGACWRPLSSPTSSVDRNCGRARMRVAEPLAKHNAAIRRELARFRGEKIDTAGDGFLASGFVGPARGIRCGCAIRDAVAAIGLDIRIGVHTGECDIVDEKLSSLAVNVGARVAAEAGEGEVLLSGTVKDLVAVPASPSSHVASAN